MGPATCKGRPSVRHMLLRILTETKKPVTWRLDGSILASIGLTDVGHPGVNAQILSHRSENAQVIGRITGSFEELVADQPHDALPDTSLRSWTSCPCTSRNKLSP